MPSVESSAIRAIDHDQATSRLEITFVTGRRYGYADVPRSVYDAFLAAPSKGEFFNHQIRDRYPYEELA